MSDLNKTTDLPVIDFFRPGFTEEPVAGFDIEAGESRSMDLDDEVGYWNGWFEENVKNDEERIARLLDTNLQVAEPIRSVLALDAGTAESEPFQVLDVGCGPLTVLGKKLNDRPLEIFGVDPLASIYAEILKRHDITAPITSVDGNGEHLSQLVEAQKYDLVYSRNALDHSFDPGLAIRQMVRACRPDHYVVFNVYRNEAVTAAYTGLHQWNFDIFNDQVVLWNPGQIVTLDNIVGGLPYTAETHTIQAEGKEKTMLTICVKVLGEGSFTKIADGFEVHVSRRDQTITMRNHGQMNSELPCFLHEISNGRNVAGQTFRWYDHVPVRSMRFKAETSQRVRVGQFDTRIEDKQARNIWSGMLERDPNAHKDQQ